MKVKIKKNVKIISATEHILDVDKDKAVSLQNKYGIDFISSIHPKKKKGLKVVFFYDHLAEIGGIETVTRNLCEEYRDYNINISFIHGSPNQLLDLSEDVTVERFTGKIECDVLVIHNFHLIPYLDDTVNIKAKYIYAVFHADFRSLAQYERYNIKKHPRITGYIAVSDACRDSLKELFNIDAVVINNLVRISDKNKGLTFIMLTRATKEKGIERIPEFIQKFKDANIPVTLLLCSNIQDKGLKIDIDLLKEINSMKEVIKIPPSIYNTNLIKNCDYLVQLSSSDSFCLSMHEGLIRGVPVIVTDFEAAKAVVKNGYNGYIVKMDMSDIDVKKIYENVPKGFEYVQPCDLSKWRNIFEKGTIE